MLHNDVKLDDIKAFAYGMSFTTEYSEQFQKLEMTVKKSNILVGERRTQLQ